MNVGARIEVVEEPASNLLRFRYSSEGRYGSLVGVNNAADRRIYPAIRIVNYTGKASVLVSCVTEHEPYRAHPHSLVGQSTTRGICYIADVITNSESPLVIDFPMLGIQSSRMNEIAAKLRQREILRIDPFRQGFQHVQELRRCLHSVRLCFQVILQPDPMNPANKILLQPQVTQPIYNIRIPSELIISDVSDISSPICGGKKIMIFCNRIWREDIQVRFFEMSGEKLIWEAYGTSVNVHRNCGISFMTPRYLHQDVNTVVNVYVQLVRPSDRARSTPLAFQYIPDLTNVDLMMKRKKCKLKLSEELFKHISEMPNPNTPSTSAQSQRYLQQYQAEQEQRQLPYEIEMFLLENIAPQEHIPQQLQQQPVQEQRQPDQPDFGFDLLPLETNAPQDHLLQQILHQLDEQHQSDEQ